MPPDDDGPVTEAELTEARERWAGAEHEPAVPELFARPVYGRGFRGDVPIRAADDSPPKE